MARAMNLSRRLGNRTSKGDPKSYLHASPLPHTVDIDSLHICARDLACLTKHVQAKHEDVHLRPQETVDCLLWTADDRLILIE